MNQSNQRLLCSLIRSGRRWLLRLRRKRRARILVVLLQRVPQVRIGHLIAVWRGVRVLGKFPFPHRRCRVVDAVLLAPHLRRVHEAVDRRQVCALVLLLVGEAGAIVDLLEESLAGRRGERHADRLLLRALAQSGARLVQLIELRRLDGWDHGAWWIAMAIEVVLLDLLVQGAVLHQGNAPTVHLLLIIRLHQVLRFDVLANTSLVLRDVLRRVAVDLDRQIILVLASSYQLGIEVDFVTIV